MRKTALKRRLRSPSHCAISCENMLSRKLPKTKSRSSSFARAASVSPTILRSSSTSVVRIPGSWRSSRRWSPCSTYKPWHDKATGKTFLRPDDGKCLHYYFYFIDKELAQEALETAGGDTGVVDGVLGIASQHECASNPHTGVSAPRSDRRLMGLPVSSRWSHRKRDPIAPFRRLNIGEERAT
jgi:hypothetical protein